VTASCSGRAQIQKASTIWN